MAAVIVRYLLAVPGVPRRTPVSRFHLDGTMRGPVNRRLVLPGEVAMNTDATDGAGRVSRAGRFARSVGRPILNGLDFVLRNVGPGLRLVAASRMDPPLPLHRYRTAGQAYKLRTRRAGQSWPI
jgi:hypothetical protein